jgi:cytoskeleton protein RodZ
MASVGVTLRNEREAQGRSIDDIAQELCLMPTYLRAIEVDDVASLPGVFFYKNFVRQYAGLLGVDPTQLQANVEELTAMAEPETQVKENPIRVPDAIVEAGNRLDFSKRTLTAPLAALAAAMIGGAFFYSWWNTPAKAAPAVVATVVTPAVASPALVSAVNAPESASVITATAPTTESTEPTVNVTTSTGADGVRRLELNLSASETTWLSITSEGKQIFAGVLHPEETKTLSGLEVARLKVGNAGGLNVQWNGKEIGPLGQKGQVRVVVFTPEGFSILPGNSSENL